MLITLPDIEYFENCTCNNGKVPDWGAWSKLPKKIRPNYPETETTCLRCNGTGEIATEHGERLIDFLAKVGFVRKI